MKFKMSLLSFTGAFLIAIMPGNAFSQEVAVTLSQSVSDGVLANPEFEVVVSSRRATDQELRQGFAGYLPSLDFSADIGREDTSDLSTRSGSEDGETLTRSQGSLTLTQMLFDGFSTSNEVKRQKARVVSSAHRVKETAEFVGLSIVEAYLMCCVSAIWSVFLTRMCVTMRIFRARSRWCVRRSIDTCRPGTSQSAP